jgi:hypothetical protein
MASTAELTGFALLNPGLRRMRIFLRWRPFQKLSQRLASIKDRLDTAAVKGQALDLCQELFLADGAQSYEEDDALQNLKELLE